MPNPRLAARYAKSIMGLAIEQNQLEPVYADMQFLQSLCSSSRDFVKLLRSPMIRPEKKEVIIRKVIEGNVGTLTLGFIRLLVRKSREESLPEMITAFITQYKDHKEIYTIRLTTAVPVSEATQLAIVDKVKDQTAMKNVELESIVDESLIGGFRLQLGDQLVDASVLYDLDKIRSQFLNNDFIYRIR